MIFSQNIVFLVVTINTGPYLLVTTSTRHQHQQLMTIKRVGNNYQKWGPWWPLPLCLWSMLHKSHLRHNIIFWKIDFVISLCVHWLQKIDGLKAPFKWKCRPKMERSKCQLRPCSMVSGQKRVQKEQICICITQKWLNISSFILIQQAIGLHVQYNVLCSAGSSPTF